MEFTAVPSVSPAAPERAARRKGTQAVLEVRGKTRLSPRLLRVTLGGEQYSELRRNHHTDAYVKLLIASEESGLLPPYDLDAIRASAPEHLPARRTYTVRHWDDEAQTLDIDVVLHGDDGAAGVAARWADAAQPGDRIALSGAGGAYSSDRLVVGCRAALPAIATALESMDPAARCLALLHLDDKEDMLTVEHPEGVELRWVIGEREQLFDQVQALDLSDTEGLQVFC